jgi:hypothetical protein
MDWNYLISFGLGALGALIIVWFRWINALPRFKSAIEIANLEAEYDAVSKDMMTKIKAKLPVDCCEVTHSENLRDDIWRQRCNSFIVSGAMYVVLGGLTALVFVGLDMQNVLDSSSIIKLISAGALWSSFYSFIEVKNINEYGLSKMAEEKKTMVEEITSEQRKQIEEYQEKINKSNNDCQTLQGKYNAVIAEYQEKIEQSNKNIETVIEKYHSLQGEYQKLSGRENGAGDAS